ncbi:MAG: hypothetical protein J6U98_02165 [Abditibacteriota bacterium]|nr:hypothetical protein [Abditibacteriota bacterium]MBP5093043.1 hypothetical protein [Abditibacteriota bacterium]MBP5738280.1 hypothetical protein [Abditibacteriota bacterium]
MSKDRNKRPSFLNRKNDEIERGGYEFEKNSAFVPKGDGESLNAVFEEIYGVVSKIPIGHFSFGVNIDEVSSLLSKARARLPEEIRKAKEVLSDSENILGAAKSNAENTVNLANDEAKRILEAAEEEAAARVSETAIVGRAHEEADRIIAEAEKEARALKDGARNYAIDLMVNLREQLDSALVTVNNGCDKLNADFNLFSETEDEY